MTIDLTTTNVLLGILAAVSVVGMLATIAALAAVIVMLRRVMALAAAFQQDQVEPAATRVNEILHDVKTITGIARGAARRADNVSGWYRIFREAFSGGPQER